MSMPPPDRAAEPTALAWTPDDVLERGVDEFKRCWPDRWQAWLDWCAKGNAAEVSRFRNPNAEKYAPPRATSFNEERTR